MLQQIKNSLQKEQLNVTDLKKIIFIGENDINNNTLQLKIQQEITKFFYKIPILTENNLGNPIEINLFSQKQQLQIIDSSIDNNYNTTDKTNITQNNSFFTNNNNNTVVIGALIKGLIINGSTEGFYLSTYTTLSLGIETLDGKFVKILPKYCIIPTSKNHCKLFILKGNEDFKINILQGEFEEKAKYNKLIDQLIITKEMLNNNYNTLQQQERQLNKDDKKMSDNDERLIEISFEITAECKLKVIVKDKLTEQVIVKMEKEVNRPLLGWSDRMFKESLEDAEKYAMKMKEEEEQLLSTTIDKNYMEEVEQKAINKEQGLILFEEK